MKTRNLLVLCGSAIASGVIASLMYTIRGLLPSIATKVIIAILVIAGLTALYAVVALVKRLHALITDIRLKHLDHHEREQRLLMETERHDLEMLALRADVHIKLSRLYADPNGNYPALLPGQFISPEEMAGNYLLFPPGQAKGINGASRIQLAQQAESRQDEQESGEQTIPASVRYEDISNQIPQGSSCLGVSRQGLETCDFKDLMTMLICGGSSTGKTNTVAIKLREAMLIGRNTHMIVIDPHKTKSDSLYNKTKQYERRFLMPVAQRDEEIIQALTWFKDEFRRRMELSTEELEQLDDVLLICDEVYSLVFHRADEQIKKLIKLVSGIAGYESRGYGMYAWFLTQKVSGLKWLRDAVMTTICHKMQTMAERTLASNDDQKVARDMDNWTMRGRVVVFGLNLPVTITQMPLLTVEGSIEPLDEMEPLQTKKAFPTSTIVDFQTEQWKRSGNGRETAQETDGNDTGELNEENAATLKKMLSDIREKRAQGRALNTILREDYGISGGRTHQEIKHLLDEIEA